MILYIGFQSMQLNMTEVYLPIYETQNSQKNSNFAKKYLIG